MPRVKTYTLQHLIDDLKALPADRKILAQVVGYGHVSFKGPNVQDWTANADATWNCLILSTDEETTVGGLLNGILGMKYAPEKMNSFVVNQDGGSHRLVDSICSVSMPHGTKHLFYQTDRNPHWELQDLIAYLDENPKVDFKTVIKEHFSYIPKVDIRIYRLGDTFYTENGLTDAFPLLALEDLEVLFKEEDRFNDVSLMTTVIPLDVFTKEFASHEMKGERLIKLYSPPVIVEAKVPETKAVEAKVDLTNLRPWDSDRNQYVVTGTNFVIEKVGSFCVLVGMVDKVGKPLVKPTADDATKAKAVGIRVMDTY